MTFVRQGGDALVHFIDLVLYFRLCTRLQREQFDSCSGYPSIGFIVESQIELRNTTVLYISLTFTDNTLWQILWLPDSCSRQLEPFVCIAVTNLWSTAERLERCSDRKIQDLRWYVTEERMPGLSEQKSRTSPIQVQVSMTQAYSRVRSTWTAEVCFHFGGSHGASQFRSLYIQSQAGI